MIPEEKLGRYEFKGGRSNKYWSIVLDRDTQTYTASWGPIGKRELGNKQYTAKEAVTKIREKENKGYVLKEGHTKSKGNNSVHFVNSFDDAA